MQAKKLKRYSILQTLSGSHSRIKRNNLSESTVPDSCETLLGKPKQIRSIKFSLQPSLLPSAKPGKKQSMNLSTLVGDESSIKGKKQSPSMIRKLRNEELLNSREKFSLQQMNRKCKLIIAKQTITQNRIKKMMLLDSQRSKTMQQSYENVEQEIANQFIAEGIRQKALFQKTLNKFSKLIDRAAKSFLDKTELNINPRNLKGEGVKKLAEYGQVCSDYSDQVFEFEKHVDPKSQSLQTNKDDVYTLLKSSNKVINIQKMNRELKNINENMKFSSMIKQQNRQKSSSAKGGQVLYHHYFRNSQSRKSLLKKTNKVC